MRGRFALALAGGLMAGAAAADVAPAPAGFAQGTFAQRAAAARAKGADEPSRPRPAKRAHREEEARPGFGPPAPHAASFAAALYARPYVRGAFVINPLVSSQYRATPEYTYLYTPAFASGSPPSPASYRYAPDAGYLLRPGLGRSAVALAYRWRYCLSHAVSPSLRAASAARSESRDRPAVSRDRGQKIDKGLAPYGMIAGGPDGLRQAGAAGLDLRLGEAFSPTPWGSSGSHRACPP
jgi:hypothetical protein